MSRSVADALTDHPHRAASTSRKAVIIIVNSSKLFLQSRLLSSVEVFLWKLHSFGVLVSRISHRTPKRCRNNTTERPFRTIDNSPYRTVDDHTFHTASNCESTCGTAQPDLAVSNIHPALPALANSLLDVHHGRDRKSLTEVVHTQRRSPCRAGGKAQRLHLHLRGHGGSCSRPDSIRIEIEFLLPPGSSHDGIAAQPSRAHASQVSTASMRRRAASSQRCSSSVTRRSIRIPLRPDASTVASTRASTASRPARASRSVA